MEFVAEDIFKLLISILLGGLIGAEREYHDKTAGFRTIIFICVGATLFTIFSAKIGGQNDPRIAANIVSGVGFLGAGVILRAGGRIVGLTTASMIWLSAAVGMGIGNGRYLFAIITTFAIMIVLWLFPKLEDWIDRRKDSRAYEITCTINSDHFKKIENLFSELELTIKKHKQTKINATEMVCTFFTSGKPRKHDEVIQKLLADEEVKTFTY